MKNEDATFEELQKLGKNIFELSRRVRLSTASQAKLSAASELVNQCSQLLGDDIWKGTVSQSHPHLFDKDKNFFSEPVKNRRTPQQIMPYSPFIGTCNPFSPRFVFTIEEPGRLVTGKGKFSEQFAGPPGCVHGGSLAGLFDELLGTVCWSGDNGGYTGTLSVRFIRPTPLSQELSLRAEHSEVSGRKSIIKGWVYHGQTLTASAEGIFIRPRDETVLMPDNKPVPRQL